MKNNNSLPPCCDNRPCTLSPPPTLFNRRKRIKTQKSITGESGHFPLSSEVCIEYKRFFTRRRRCPKKPQIQLAFLYYCVRSVVDTKSRTKNCSVFTSRAVLLSRQCFVHSAIRHRSSLFFFFLFLLLFVYICMFNCAAIPQTHLPILLYAFKFYARRNIIINPLTNHYRSRLDRLTSNTCDYYLFNRGKSETVQ